MKEIVLKFDIKTGECKVQAEGFKGSSCQDATKFLKNTLGQVSDFQKKSDWFEENLEITGCFNSNLCG